MIIEDNPDHAELTSMAIKKSDGAVEIIVFDDGFRAMDYLNNCLGKNDAAQDAALPNLILLDIKMPGMDGFEVLKKVKNDPGTKEIPVVMLTTSNRPEDIELAYSLGANSYLTKPVVYKEVKEKISSLINYWQNMNETI